MSHGRLFPLVTIATMAFFYIASGCSEKERANTSGGGSLFPDNSGGNGKAGAPIGGTAGTAGTAGMGGTAGMSEKGGSGGSGGTNTTGGQGGWPSDCPTVSTNSFCQNCVESLCNQECLTCGANPECKALHACILTCSLSTCYSECENQHPSGVADLQALLGDQGCMAASCGPPCGASTGGQGGGTGGSGGIATTVDCDGPFSSECAECLAEHCQNECSTCTASTNCQNLLECIAKCTPGDSPCEQSCRTSHSNGVDAFDSLFSSTGCGTSHCAAQCLP